MKIQRYHSRPDGSISVVRDGAQTVDGDGGGDRKSEERNPLNVPDQITPCDGWQVLLLLNRLCDIVVWDVGVGRGESGLDLGNDGVLACRESASIA